MDNAALIMPSVRCPRWRKSTQQMDGLDWGSEVNLAEEMGVEGDW